MNIGAWIVGVLAGVLTPVALSQLPDWVTGMVAFVGVVGYLVLYLYATKARNRILSGDYAFYNVGYHLRILLFIQWLGQLGALSSVVGLLIAFAGNVDFARGWVAVPAAWIWVYMLSPYRRLLQSYLTELA